MVPGPPKELKMMGPISQNREHRQYGVHYVGHFGGPGKCIIQAVVVLTLITVK